MQEGFKAPRRQRRSIQKTLSGKRVCGTGRAATKAVVGYGSTVSIKARIFAALSHIFLEAYHETKLETTREENIATVARLWTSFVLVLIPLRYARTVPPWNFMWL